MEHSSSPPGVPWPKTQGPLELCHVVGLLLNGEPASKLETTLAKQETDKPFFLLLSINSLIKRVFFPYEHFLLNIGFHKSMTIK